MGTKCEKSGQFPSDVARISTWGGVLFSGLICAEGQVECPVARGPDGPLEGALWWGGVGESGGAENHCLDGADLGWVCPACVLGTERVSPVHLQMKPVWNQDASVPTQL